jgi:hypothetical protein
MAPEHLQGFVRATGGYHGYQLALIGDIQGIQAEQLAGSAPAGDNGSAVSFRITS